MAPGQCGEIDVAELAEVADGLLAPLGDAPRSGDLLVRGGRVLELAATATHHPCRG